jgi:hypothetical protein
MLNLSMQLLKLLNLGIRAYESSVGSVDNHHALTAEASHEVIGGFGYYECVDAVLKDDGSFYVAGSGQHGDITGNVGF